jgi:hypothetical protein
MSREVQYSESSEKFEMSVPPGYVTYATCLIGGEGAVILICSYVVEQSGLSIIKVKFV